MPAQVEPIVQFSPEGSTITLQRTSPVPETDFAGKTHLTEKRTLVFEVPAAGTAQATYDLWTVPAGAWVKNVDAVILEAFDSSVTIALQDAAIWIAAGELNEQLAGSCAKSALSSGGALQNGKYYSAKDTLDLVLAGADATVGKIAVTIEFESMWRFGAQDLA